MCYEKVENNSLAALHLQYSTASYNSSRVISCFLLVNPTDKEVLMMEKKLEGRYVKYLNNSGIATETGSSTDDGHVCLALAHWSLEYNEGKLLLTDLQGKIIIITLSLQRVTRITCVVIFI